MYLAKIISIYIFQMIRNFLPLIIMDFGLFERNFFPLFTLVSFISEEKLHHFSFVSSFLISSWQDENLFHFIGEILFNFYFHRKIVSTLRVFTKSVSTQRKITPSIPKKGSTFHRNKSPLLPKKPITFGEIIFHFKRKKTPFISPKNPVFQALFDGVK